MDLLLSRNQSRVGKTDRDPEVTGVSVVLHLERRDEVQAPGTGGAPNAGSV